MAVSAADVVVIVGVVIRVEHIGPNIHLRVGRGGLNDFMLFH